MVDLKYSKNKGKYQEYYDKFWSMLVPKVGMATTDYGELLREFSLIYSAVVNSKYRKTLKLKKFWKYILRYKFELYPYMTDKNALNELSKAFQNLNYDLTNLADDWFGYNYLDNIMNAIVLYISNRTGESINQKPSEEISDEETDKTEKEEDLGDVPDKTKTSEHKSYRMRRIKMKNLNEVFHKEIMNAYKHHVTHLIPVKPVDIIVYIQENIKYELTDKENSLLREMVCHNHVELLRRYIHVLMEDETAEASKIAKKIKFQFKDLGKIENAIMIKLKKIKEERETELANYKKSKNDEKKMKASVEKLKDIQKRLKEAEEDYRKIKTAYEEAISNVSSDIDVSDLLSKHVTKDDKSYDDFGKNF